MGCTGNFCGSVYYRKLDGTIARKYNLIIKLWKIHGPLADKLLVCSAMICFVGLGTLAPWIVIIIVAREFIISGFRLIAAENGRVIAAGIWGKAKTVVQMIMCILLIMDVSALSVVTTIAIYAALFLRLSHWLTILYTIWMYYQTRSKKNKRTYLL